MEYAEKQLELLPRRDDVEEKVNTLGKAISNAKVRESSLNRNKRHPFMTSS